MELNNSQFEALLKDAVCEYHIEELKAIPSNKELKAAYTLSPEFYRKMELILNVKKKEVHKYNIIRILKYAAIIVLMIGTLAMTNSDVRAKIKEIFFEIFEEYGVMTFNSDGENVITSLEDIEFKLGYVPDGFELENEIKDRNMVNIYYTSDQEEVFIIEFCLVSNEEYDLKTDIKGMIYEDIIINGKFEGYFRSSEDNNKENSLICYNGDMGFYVTITANLSKEELIKIAENITY